MNLITRRRLFRLEKRVASVVAEQKRREPEEKEWQRQAALYHARKPGDAHFAWGAADR
jgi:hypothetical protein